MIECFDAWMNEVIANAPDWHCTKMAMHFRNAVWTKYRTWDENKKEWVKR